MKLLPFSTAFIAVLSTGAYAFPSMALPNINHLSKAFDGDFLKRAGLPALIDFPDNFGLANEGRPFLFDEKLQRIDVVYAFPWQKPGPTDQRGPCAGLNALANHGIISRNGILTQDDILSITNATGLSIGVTTFLYIATLLFDGDPLTGRISIGGYDPRVSQGGLLEGNLLGRASGFCRLGHLKNEADASVTRGDYSQPTGENDNCRSYPSYFQELLDLGRAKYPQTGHITPSILASHHNNRKLYSISHNPNFFSPAFGGFVVVPAAHHFVFALMAPKSAEHPQGYMSPEDLMSWFSYTKDAQGNLIQTHGYERIPASFYKRHPLQQWTIPDVLLGIVQQLLAYPKTMAIGGNTGRVNSFAGINIGDLTGGAFNYITELSEPVRLGCFLSQVIQAEAPSIASNVLEGPLVQHLLDWTAGILIPTLTSSFGACNEILQHKAKPMSHYKDQYPSLTYGVQDESRAKSPAPGT